jgi:hypothetical protein
MLTLCLQGFPTDGARAPGGGALASSWMVCYNSEAGYGARGAGAAQAVFGYFGNSNLV